MEVKERKQALKDGDKFYFTGRECKNGHLDKRYSRCGRCLSCCKDHNKSNYRSRKSDPQRKEYMRDYLKSYTPPNPRSEYSRKHYQSNRDQILAKAKEYRDQNKGLYAFLCQSRRKKIKKATPAWLNDEQRNEMISIYNECAELNRESKNSHHVDHIIPIGGSTVCGLHVPWNLQVITKQENLRKGNKLTA